MQSRTLVLLAILVCLVGYANADRVDVLFGCSQFYNGSFSSIVSGIQSQCSAGSCSDSCKTQISNFISQVMACGSIVQSQSAVVQSIMAFVNSYSLCFYQNNPQQPMFQGCSNANDLIQQLTNFATECGFAANANFCSSKCTNSFSSLIKAIEKCVGVNGFPLGIVLSTLQLFCTQASQAQCKANVRYSVIQLSDVCASGCSANCSKAITSVQSLATAGGCLSFANSQIKPMRRRCLSCYDSVRQKLNSTIATCRSERNCTAACNSSIQEYANAAASCYTGDLASDSYTDDVASSLLRKFCVVQESKMCMLDSIQSFLSSDGSCLSNFCNTGCLSGMQGLANSLATCFPGSVPSDIKLSAQQQGAACNLLNNVVARLTLSGLTPAQVLAGISGIINAMAAAGNITADRIIIFSVGQATRRDVSTDITFQITPSDDSNARSASSAVNPILAASSYTSYTVSGSSVVADSSSNPDYSGSSSPMPTSAASSIAASAAIASLAALATLLA